MTEAVNVAIVGAGRLARALVRALPADAEVVVVARREPVQPLPRQGVTVTSEIAAIAGADVVIPAVPAEQVGAVLERVACVVEEHTIVFNVATDLATHELAARFDRLRVIATKIVGQAGEIERGSPAAVAVDHADDALYGLAQRLLGAVGVVMRFDERRVAELNTAVGEEMARAVLRCRARLEAMGLPPEIEDAAIATMAVGAFRAIATGTHGPFLRRIVERVQTTA